MHTRVFPVVVGCELVVYEYNRVGVLALFTNLNLNIYGGFFSRNFVDFDAYINDIKEDFALYFGMGFCFPELFCLWGR